jgi:hypothetical protein
MNRIHVFILTAIILTRALVFCADVCAEETIPVLQASAIAKRLPVTENFTPRVLPDERWQFFSGKKDAALADTWSIVSEAESPHPIIVCRGEPYGYLRTVRAFQNFDMELEWRYPKDEHGNSGILLFTSGDNRIWPTSLQIQLHQPEAGSTFPQTGAKSDNELRNVAFLSKPVNQWNRCEIISREGKVTVTINGQKVGEVTGCQPRSGAISLQSEGSEIHFRKIIIREFPSDT